MDPDEDHGPKDADIPWGKYTYTLEGLAKECYLEGATNIDLRSRPGAPPGKRLRFRVELPERCFILSIAVKLPNAPQIALQALEDVCIERTLRSAEYEIVHNGVLSAPRSSSADNADSPTGVVATAQSSRDNPRKKVIEMRRAADSLRITLADIDPPEDSDEKMRDVTDSESDMEGNKAGEFRILGLSVVGYVRGQTPVAGRIKILLNSSTRLGLNGVPADRAEIDGLLGLAFLGNKRYRQAAELLERASNLTREVAIADMRKGFQGELGFSWAAELNLLAAHAYFEHEPRSNDGIARLIAVVASGRPRASSSSLNLAKELRSGAMESLDLRTELLGITAPLMEKLVRFLGASNSLAVQMASARMIEFVGEQLGCAIAPFIGQVLDQVLRDYPEVKPLGARDKASSSSFSYDSMEDCYKKLVDICCRLLPLTEHSVLQRISEHTLMPVLHDAFDETKYLIDSENVEEEADDLLCNAVSQTLRLIYLVLTILGGDANVPPSFVAKLLDILVLEEGNSRTPLVLRRSALHTWDAMVRSVVQSANKLSVKDFKEYITVQVPYIHNMVMTVPRSPFEYSDTEENEDYLERRSSIKENIPSDISASMQLILEKKNERVKIMDRHTLNRLLYFMTQTFLVLEPCTEEDERHTATVAIMRLLRVLNESAADVFMSGLMDVSVYAAVSIEVGPKSNLSYFEYGNFSAQMKVSCETLTSILETYWATLRLLPSRAAEDAEKQFLVRSVLTWCTEKMKETAPPRGMLNLIMCVVMSFQSDSSCTFKQDFDISEEAKPLDLYRVNNIWLSQTSHIEALDLHDILCPIVGRHLMARDILDAIHALGDQLDELDGRSEASAAVLAHIIVNFTPVDPSQMKASLADIVDLSLDKPRIVDGFPKSSSTSRGSTFSRKLRFASTQADHDPKTASLYTHTVLASCFDEFDSLSKPAKCNVGGLCMADYLDAFIEHAAFLVRCLNICAKKRKHREYIDDTLGDILKTCLDMQNHGDGRVRLAGFEIFAAALDVLFLTEGSAHSEGIVSDTAGLGVLQRSNSHNSTEAIGSVKELLSESTNGIQVTSLANENGYNSFLSQAEGQVLVEETNNAEENGNTSNSKQDESTSELFSKGGKCVFHATTSSASDLKFEEHGWLMLCNYMSTSLGMGKYADFVVHRACLEYIRGCILNALQGKSSGASVISFYHVESIWDAVLRLVGSPVHSLNGLALWVICATINVGIYSAVMAKRRGESKQRAVELEKFVTSKLFITAENFIKGGSKEMRLWGGRLLEVYIRARSMNAHSVEVCPPPSQKVLMAIRTLQNDWCEEARALAKSLLDMHFELPVNKPSTPSSSFTDRAQTFFRDRRFGGGTEQEEPEPSINHSKIELWFPALPQVSSTAKMERFGKTLEAFANAEIAGGEETAVDYSDDEYQPSEYSRDDSIGYEDEEDGEFESEEVQEEPLLTSNTSEDVQIEVDIVENEPPESPLEDPEGNNSPGKLDDSIDSLDVVDGKDKEKVDGAVPEFEPDAEKPGRKQDDTESLSEKNDLKEPEDANESTEPEQSQTSDEPLDSEGNDTTQTHDAGNNRPSHLLTKTLKTSSPLAKESDGIEDDDLDIGDKVDDEFDEFGVTLIAEPEEEEADSKNFALEKRPSLPRVGSFTDRKRHDVHAEGEYVRLEKRRSESSFNRKWSNERDEEHEVSSSPGIRRQRIKESSSLKSFDSEPLNDGGYAGFAKGGRSPREVASAGFLPIPQRRVQRGVKLDEEVDELGRDDHASSPPKKRVEELRRQFENSNRSGSRPTSRRSLPRVPAFTKGGPPRRFGSSSAVSEKGVGFETFPAPSSGSSSSNAPSTGSRRFTRTRSSSRMSKKIDDIGRRFDDGESGADSSAVPKAAGDRRRARRIGSDELVEKRGLFGNERNQSR